MVAAMTHKQWAGLVEGLGVAAEVAAIEERLGISLGKSDHNRFTNREELFALFQSAAEKFDYAELAARFAAAGATFERYRTMHEASTDPQLVTENPLFGPSPANPSGFEYPAAGPFANIPALERGDPRPAPYLGEHSEEILARVLGMGSGEFGKLIDAGIVATSDKV